MEPDQNKSPRNEYRPARRELALALGSLALVGAVGVGALATPSLTVADQLAQAATPAAPRVSPTRVPRATTVALAQAATTTPAAKPAKTPKPAAAATAPKPATQPKPAAAATAPKPATQPKPAAAAKPTPAPAQQPQLITHTVRAGDLLWTLARNYGVTMNDILAINTIPNPDSLKIGQVLRIPQKSQQ